MNAASVFAAAETTATSPGQHVVVDAVLLFIRLAAHFKRFGFSGGFGKNPRSRQEA